MPVTGMPGLKVRMLAKENAPTGMPLLGGPVQPEWWCNQMLAQRKASQRAAAESSGLPVAHGCPARGSRMLGMAHRGAAGCLPLADAHRKADAWGVT